DSPLLRRNSVAKMAEAQPGLVTLEVPDCGHAPMLDRAAQVDPIADFLEREREALMPATPEAPASRWWRRLLARLKG
ncbi:alpha/beta fold hydrolase, partial [Halomonas campaniensis]|uniref:alpha/beta fold hydrolase n=1 Tax=Halomonas campaniensis TaxID=213554 RepID=UPI0039704C54